MNIKTLVVLVWFGFLTACGGGESSNYQSSSSGASSPTNTQVEATPTGNATITKTYKPGVIVVPSTVASQTLSPTKVVIGKLPSGAISPGNVFVLGDRAYVASSVASDNNGQMTINVRDASFDEVLDDIAIKGDITLEDVDVSHAIVGVEDGSSIISVQAFRTPRNTTDRAVSHATTVNLGTCALTIADNKFETSSASCNVSEVKGDFKFTGTLGVKNILFKGLSGAFKTKNFSLVDTNFTPYMNVTVTVVTEPSVSGVFKGDKKIARFQLPIAQTLGFVSVHVPLYFTYEAPKFNFGMGMGVDLPYKDGKFDLVGNIQTPTSTLTTPTGGFEAKLDHAFVGLKLGVEVKVAPVPSPVMEVVPWFFNGLDSVLAVGVFGVGGEEGSLSVKTDNLKAKPCFRWNLGPRAKAILETKLLEEPISTLTASYGDSPGALDLVTAPRVEGSSGCDEGPKGFWEGTASIERCDIPIGVKGGCNFLSYNINVNDSVDMAFRSGAETLNLRLDQVYGCNGATVGISESAGSSFTISRSTGEPFAVAPSSTTVFTVTEVTDTQMRGTFVSTFDLKLYNGQSGSGTGTGSWVVRKRATTFPKCLPPLRGDGMKKDGTPAGGRTPSFFCPSFQPSDDLWGCDYRPLYTKGRDGEWILP